MLVRGVHLHLAVVAWVLPLRNRARAEWKRGALAAPMAAVCGEPCSTQGRPQLESAHGHCAGEVGLRPGLRRRPRTRVALFGERRRKKRSMTRHFLIVAMLIGCGGLPPTTAFL